MKFRSIHGLVTVAILLPMLFALLGKFSWTVGCLIGEVLGLISYVWVGLSVKYLLTLSAERANRKLVVHSLGRYLMMGFAIFWATQTPMINVFALVMGYSIIQLPAAIIRSLAYSR